MIDTSALAFNTKSFKGSYLLFRKDGDRLKKERRVSARPPRCRHPNFTSAEAEAKRLLREHPASTFVILQEVARVKTTEPYAMTSGGADADENVAHIVVPAGQGRRAVLGVRFGDDR